MGQSPAKYRSLLFCGMLSHVHSGSLTDAIDIWTQSWAAAKSKYVPKLGLSSILDKGSSLNGAGQCA